MDVYALSGTVQACMYTKSKKNIVRNLLLTSKKIDEMIYKSEKYLSEI